MRNNHRQIADLNKFRISKAKQRKQSDKHNEAMLRQRLIADAIMAEIISEILSEELVEVVK